MNQHPWESAWAVAPAKVTAGRRAADPPPL